MKFTQEQIKATTIGAVIGLFVFLCIGLSALKQIKSSVEPIVKVDTVIVHDTITVHDTIKVEVVKNVYIKQKPSRKIDYARLFSLKWKHSDLCSKSRDHATNGNIDLAKLYLAQARIVGSRLDDYKSHLIYVD